MFHRHVKTIAAHPETRRFTKFAIVGFMNTSIDLIIYLLLHTVFGMHYLLANLIAFLFGATNSYVFNRRWTFRSTADDWRREMIKFFIVLAIGFSLNEGLLYVLVDRFGFGSTFAKLPVIAIVLIWNFGANRLWTFRHSLPPHVAKPE